MRASVLLCFCDSASAQYYPSYYQQTYPTTSNPTQNYSGPNPPTDGVEIEGIRYNPIGSPPVYQGNPFDITQADNIGLSTYSFAPVTPTYGQQTYYYHKMRFYPLSGIGPVTEWVSLPGYYIP